MNTSLRAVRLVPLAFLTVIAAGALLLMLPASRTAESGEVLMPAMFTSVSAVCVTGLITVDTANYWTPFGQAVILGLIQIGGFGIMTVATMLGLLVSGKLGLRSMMGVQAETRSLNLGDIGTVLRRIGLTAVAFEAVTAAVLTARFRLEYDDTFGTALWHGTFHSISSFNNAGFSLFSGSLIPLVADPWICVPMSTAVIAGGIGFPVLAELMRRAPPSRWTVHTRITVYGSLLLLATGVVAVLAFEWSNPATLGPLALPAKLNAAFTSGVMPRTAGFNSIDYAQTRVETLTVTGVLMFIGGGSAGTAGGIKVTTFFLLAYVIWAAARGDDDVVVGSRAVTGGAQRQALTVALLGVAIVATGTMAILLLTDYTLEVVMFESVSAFATVGLSTGITPSLPTAAGTVLMLLMFVGRVGTITVASALALRSTGRRYRLPEERPILG